MCRNQGIVLAVDIGGTNIRSGWVTKDGNILQRGRLSTPKGLDASQLRELLKVFKKSCQDSHYKLLGVGIGIAGAIDQDRGVVTQSPNFKNWSDFPVREVLQSVFADIPLVIENDANAHTVGEWWLGSGKNKSYVVCMTLGTGVGGGIILDNKLIRGRDGTAGEIGHLTVEPNGFKCNCGNKGCLEAYASLVGLKNLVKFFQKQGKFKNLKINDNLPKLLAERAKKGDKESLDIFRIVGKYLGIAIADLINLLNVEVVVISGGISNAFNLFIDSTKEEMCRRAFKKPLERVVIRKGALGDVAGLVGLAKLVIEQKIYTQSTFFFKKSNEVVRSTQVAKKNC